MLNLQKKTREYSGNRSSKFVLHILGRMKESTWHIRLKSFFNGGIIFMNSMKDKMEDHIVPSTEFIWWRKARACPRASHFMYVPFPRRKRSIKLIWQRRTDIALSSGRLDLKEFVQWEEKMQETHSYSTHMEMEIFCHVWNISYFVIQWYLG